MSSHGISEKAARYITQLYEARCNGDWLAVPELARKVEKHAPQRTLLPLASRANARIYSNPSITSYRTAQQEYGQRLAAELSAVIDTSSQDALDASMCLAAISYGIGAYGNALSHSVVHLDDLQASFSGHGAEGWQAVCVVQGTLIRGLTYEQSRDYTSAAQTYRSMIAYLSHIIELPSQCAELRRWSEELLCHICSFFSTDKPDKPAQLGEAMAGFHLLSKQLDSQGWRPLNSSVTFSKHTPRAIWRAYYEALSKIVRDDLVYHPSPSNRREGASYHGFLDDDDYLASRIQQRADLRRVEVNYENLLVNEVPYPHANESNEEVRSWVDLVMSNWRILCGPRWTNEELGPGGKLVVGRNTLDILYRAATKTFHSTQILRSLFTIHAYLGEFKMALKAFDTYVEIVSRGSARSDRSGSAGLDLDDDETAVMIAAEAMSISCRYGSERSVERMTELRTKLEAWLGKSTLQADGKAMRDTEHSAQGSVEISPQAALSPHTRHLAHFAIGISQAHSARFASSPSLRAELHRQAIYSLERTINQTEISDTQSFFAMALLLAETRDIVVALDTVKKALHAAEGIVDFSNPEGMNGADDSLQKTESNVERFDRRRRSLPIWHLLAQLLSAQQDYQMALSCCMVALEHFNSSADVLINQNGTKHDQFPSNTSMSPQGSRRISRGALTESRYHRMQSYEKHTVVEMKMTELSLLERLEGPDAAINASGDIFSLFTRLFGVQDLDRIRPSPEALKPPKTSSGGTVRSMFGRQKQPGTMRSQRTSFLPSATSSAMISRPGTSSGPVAPTIHVTAENGAVSEPRQSIDGRSSHRNPLRRKTSGSVRRHFSLGSRPTTAHYSGRSSMEVPAFSGEVAQPQTIPETEQLRTGLSDAPSRGQELGAVTHNMPHERLPLPTGQHEQPVQQDMRLPVPPPTSNENLHSTSTSDSPHPHFDKLEEYRATTSLLVKVWLFVARLYTSSTAFHDALLAIHEANILVAAIETAVAQKNGVSLKYFQERGWGAAKSVEELWADVYNERGRLAVAEAQPHDALPHFERALSHAPDHAETIVALSSLLLDIGDGVISSEKPDSEGIDTLIPDVITTATPSPTSQPTANGSTIPPTGSPITTPSTPASASHSTPSHPTDTHLLNRTAARDRAYGLLSSLTRLPQGWDDSEAWFVLSRAYEESGQLGKAKEALWTVVQLEDTRPVRRWLDVSPGGFVL